MLKNGQTRQKRFKTAQNRSEVDIMTRASFYQPKNKKIYLKIQKN